MSTFWGLFLVQPWYVQVLAVIGAAYHVFTVWQIFMLPITARMRKLEKRIEEIEALDPASKS